MNLISPKELKEAFPLTLQEQNKIESFRNEARALLSSCSKKVLIIGPCSIHDYSCFLEYAKKLKELSDVVKEQFFIVIRAYIEKSRTSIGWKGFLYQPSPWSHSNLSEGLILSRKLFIEVTRIGLPIAVEIVDPITSYYFEDLITWGCIGARTCSSQTHRQISSLLKFPIGFKNSLSGDLFGALNGMKAAAKPQHFFGMTPDGRICQINSNGNPYTNLVLRGGNQITNYDAKSVEFASDLAKENDVCNFIVVDCSHGNSKKNLSRQQEIFIYLIQLIKEQKQSAISGIMLESYLQEGKIDETYEPMEKTYSITDPCLGFETTKKLILWASEQLAHSFSLAELN